MKRVYHCCQNIITVIIAVSVKVRSKTIVKITILLTVVDPGVGPGGPGPPCLFLDQTEARRAKKFLFLILHPPFLRV